MADEVRVTGNAREDFLALDAQYRLRVDTIRLFYDIEGDHVNVLGIVPKDRVDEWLARYGETL